MWKNSQKPSVAARFSTSPARAQNKKMHSFLPDWIHYMWL